MCVFCVSAAIDFFQLFNSDPRRLYARHQPPKRLCCHLDEVLVLMTVWIQRGCGLQLGKLSSCISFHLCFQNNPTVFHYHLFIPLSSFLRGCKGKYSQYIYNDFASDTLSLSLFVTDILTCLIKYRYVNTANYYHVLPY